VFPDSWLPCLEIEEKEILIISSVKYLPIWSFQGTFLVYLLLQSFYSVGYIIWSALEHDFEGVWLQTEIEPMRIFPFANFFQEDEPFSSSKQLPDQLSQSCLFALCLALLLLVYNDNIFKKYPFLLNLCSFVVAFMNSVRLKFLR